MTLHGLNIVHGVLLIVILVDVPVILVYWRLLLLKLLLHELFLSEDHFFLLVSRSLVFSLLLHAKLVQVGRGAVQIVLIELGLRGIVCVCCRFALELLLRRALLVELHVGFEVLAIRVGLVLLVVLQQVVVEVDVVAESVAVRQILVVLVLEPVRRLLLRRLDIVLKFILVAGLNQLVEITPYGLLVGVLGNEVTRKEHSGKLIDSQILAVVPVKPAQNILVIQVLELDAVRLHQV